MTCWTNTLYMLKSTSDTALVVLTAVTLRIEPLCSALYEAAFWRPPIPRCVFILSWPRLHGRNDELPRAGFSSGVSVLSNANVPNLLFCLFHSQEALSVFKEAIQKMPRQFAPQSLYNMMGKSCSCFRTMSIIDTVFTVEEKSLWRAWRYYQPAITHLCFTKHKKSTKAVYFLHIVYYFGLYFFIPCIKIKDLRFPEQATIKGNKNANMKTSKNHYSGL